MIKDNPFKYVFLYLPFFMSWVLIDLPHVSYLISWFGSIYIFYLSYSGLIQPLPTDIPVIAQLMRPIFLLQFIFAGYMSCTSIFYYVNALGYEYADLVGAAVLQDIRIFNDIARCQCYYVLGHAAFVHGIMLAMRYPVPQRYALYTASMSNLLLGISIVCLPLAYAFSRLGALSQFSVQLNGLSFVAGTIALSFAIREHKKANFILSLGLFVSNLYTSLISGFKEPIIICFLLLGIFLLPIYGKKLVPIFGVLFVVLLFVLPTFISNFRKLTGEGTDVITARDNSINALVNADTERLEEDNWEFLVFRFSEIDMFIKYIHSTPQFVPFYRAELLKNAATTVIPRFFWSSKPVVETLIMERVYKAGVVDRSSMVSAKPAYIVDCYLSFGMFGIFVGLFVYGFVAQWIANKAEELFGGYFMGCAVVFAGLFQIFWRGNSFEFLVNAVFWSYVTMLLLFYFLKFKSILTEQ